MPSTDPLAVDPAAGRPHQRSLAGQCAPYAAVALLGGFLAWLSDAHPGKMPVWAPWEFSSLEYFSVALALVWFFQGLAREPVDSRPGVWRKAAFLGGLGTIYLVLQTRFDYWAQHLFLLNRVQHVVMHHLGPFLVALAGANETIERGMPAWARRIAHSRVVSAILRVLQQPLLAGILFSGSFFFWLIPSIHFRAMIDARLYQIMNWTMVLDGLLFWSLALDRRPRPPARISFGARAALVVGVMVPQSVFGSLLTFWTKPLYPSYDLCGRLLPSMSALTDQHIGGIVVWIPPIVLGIVGLLVVAFAMQRARSELR